MQQTNNQGIVGGDKSKPRSDFPHGFFFPESNVSYQILRTQKNDVRHLRILPAFDPDADLTTAEGKRSFIPFMNDNGQLTSWFFYVMGYTFLGEKNKQFISPIVLLPREERFVTRGVDPIRDCYLYAKNHNDPDVQNLTKQVSKKVPAVIPSARDFVLLNAYIVKNDGQTDVSVLIITKTAMLDLEEQLEWRTGKDDPVINENYPDIIYGDPTDPATGLLLRVEEKQSKGASVYNFAGLSFATKKMTLEGAQALPIDPSTSQGQSILERRYNIGDTENITRIPSYGELLEYIVEYTNIPYDIIIDACSPYYDGVIPTRRSASSSVGAGPKTSSDKDAAADSAFVKPSPVTPSPAVPTKVAPDVPFPASSTVASEQPEYVEDAPEAEPEVEPEAPSPADNTAAVWTQELEDELQALSKLADSNNSDTVAQFYSDIAKTRRFFDLRKLKLEAQSTNV